MTTTRDDANDIGAFLASRRARLSPEAAGLEHYGRRRRVTGLRREEVARLAGISVEYYTRLERGRTRGVSDEVVESVTRALQLDDVEHAHLVDMVRTANTSPINRRRRTTPQQIRPALRQLLDAMTETAAFIRNSRLDVLATNALGAALYAPVLQQNAHSSNLARFIFLNANASHFYRDWNGIARDAVGSLRTAAGHQPGDASLSELVGDLSIRSDDFRSLWAAHNVRYYRSGVQKFHHPEAGDLDLEYDALEIAADPGLTLIAYTAQRDTTSHRALMSLRVGNP